MKNKKAIVVGSGIAGMASALRLRAKGYDVELFEANAYPGGKLTEIQLNDFIFDAGPSLFTMPHLVDELFTLFHKNPKDYFDYVENDTLCHYFFEDGTVLNFKKDPNALKNEVETKLNVDFEPLKKHIEKSKYIYDATHHIFLEKSLHEPKNYLHLNVLKSVLKMPRLQLLNTMNKANEKALNHPKLVQIFNRFATYNGSNPYQAPGILNIIPHLEHGIGSFFPKNGMHSITTSLIKLAKEESVLIHLNSKVSEIVVENSIVKGIKVNDCFYQADVVVCNADIKPAYKYLLPDLKKPTKRLQQEPSSSAMIFYWGINQSFPNLDLHNILFSESYQKEFKAIFEEGTVIDDPTVYIHISSKIAKHQAPKGKENWFILVNVPANTGQNWEGS